MCPSLIIALLCTCYGIAVTSPVEPMAQSPGSSNSWSNMRSVFNQQSLQNMLISIDERLRNIDTTYSARFNMRWEIAIEQQSRQLETIESRLERLEALLQIRLDKIIENMNSRYLKEDLTKDQISHKLDSTYDRLNHRLGYMEARLDIGLTKMQSNVEAMTRKFEQVEATNGNRQVDMESEILNVGANIEDLKKQIKNFEESYNTTLVNTVCEAVNEHSDQLSITADIFREELNSSLQVLAVQNNQRYHLTEASNENVTHLLNNILNGLEDHVTNFATKANNMYNDIWKRTQNIEGLVKNSMSLCNVTRREVQDGFRSFFVQMSRRGLLQYECERQRDKENPGTLELAIEALTSTMQTRFTDLEGQLGSSFQMLQMAQNLFLESCHRIQSDEPQMEMKLTEVLERILDTINNRSTNTEEEIETMQQLLKSHNNQVVRTLGHNTNNIMRVSERNNEDTKYLEKIFLGLQQHILETNKNIENILTDFIDEKVKSTEKLDAILNTLQEYQEHTNYNERENIKDSDAETMLEDHKFEKEKLTDTMQDQDNRFEKSKEDNFVNITALVGLLISEIKSRSNLCSHENSRNEPITSHNIDAQKKSLSKLLEKSEHNKTGKNQEIDVLKSAKILSDRRTAYINYTTNIASPKTLPTAQDNYKINTDFKNYKNSKYMTGQYNITSLERETQSSFLPLVHQVPTEYPQNLSMKINDITQDKPSSKTDVGIDNVGAVIHNSNTNILNSSLAESLENHRFLTVGNVTLLIDSAESKTIFKNSTPPKKNITAQPLILSIEEESKTTAKKYFPIENFTSEIEIDSSYISELQYNFSKIHPIEFSPKIENLNLNISLDDNYIKNNLSVLMENIILKTLSEYTSDTTSNSTDITQNLTKANFEKSHTYNLTDFQNANFFTKLSQIYQKYPELKYIYDHLLKEKNIEHKNKTEVNLYKNKYDQHTSSEEINESEFIAYDEHLNNTNVTPDLQSYDVSD